MTGDAELGHLLSFFYDRVASAELGDEELTYDLSVPSNVTYVANGFVSHNTIGLMMDCDTTGIEPDLGLVKMKKLVGGGTMSIVNQTIPRALRRLGYTAEQVDEIVAYIDAEKTILGAPHLDPEHLAVFACSMGDNTIHYEGHVRMMGAVQPFLSGAICKTVNMPEEATVEEVEALHQLSWELGLKAVAIYRDNCKVGQPLSTTKKEDTAAVRREDRREDGGEGRPPAAAPEAAAQPAWSHVRVPRRRLQGLRHDRRVRRRAARRDLPHRVQAGLDAVGDHGRLRQVDLLRPAVRRAAAGVRRGVHEHALRAGRHDRRPGHPLRHVDHGLPVPPPGHRVLDASTSGPSWASSPSTSACSRRCRASTRR